MRLNAICLIAALPVLGIPLSARAIPSQADHQPVVSAQQVAPVTDTCPAGYYWEPDGYAPHGKFRPAHCAFRW